MSAVEIITSDARGDLDRAEADTPEDALFAAQTLLAEAHAHRGTQGYYRTLRARFVVAGVVVRTVTYQSIGGRS